MRDRDDLLGWMIAEDARAIPRLTVGRWSMAFDPKQLWQLSILETAGIATIIASALLIAGIVFSIWQ